MKKLTEIKSISALLKNDKAVKLIVAGGLLIIVGILIFDLFGGGSQTGYSGNSAENYSAALERRLADIVSEIEGVGRIKVMVTLENLDENVYSERETSVKTIITPTVRGVAIVCEGGDNILIKEKIVNTVARVLGISTARVSVTY